MTHLSTRLGPIGTLAVCCAIGYSIREIEVFVREKVFKQKSPYRRLDSPSPLDALFMIHREPPVPDTKDTA